AAMFHWSVVGAVSLSVTASPVGPVTWPVYCDQKASPERVLRNWWSISWLGPRVLAVALSQSLPTANTSDLGPLVVSVTEGAALEPAADWRPAPAGPSAATKASSTSPASPVVNGWVVTALRPSAETLTSITKHGPGTDGFSTFTVTEGEVPMFPAASVAFAVS